MGEGTRILPGLPAIAGKPVHVGFDGGRLTSDAGILLLSAVEQQLKITERLTACIEDPREPALRQAQESAARTCRDDPLPHPIDRGRLSRRQ